ncbi:hypothetical protein ACFQV2_04510 [Actinokineospora soli]|uniref:Uncharacterized protein n=1 Tax=Actinokineospora soli TaxID=1048753 RepID=A0ABW2THM4_9PSEU
MIVRAAVALAGLTLLAACGTASPGSPVATPSNAPTATPSQVPSTTKPVVPVTKPAATTTEKPAATTTKKPVVTTKKPVSDSNAVIGPTGWQTLHLGMSPAAAEALGVATPMAEGDDLCQVWPAVGASALERVIVHPEHGVFAIHPKEADWIHTPEGMHIGWTAAQVAATYPDFDPAHMDYAHGPTVTVPGNPAAVYRMQFDGSGVLVRFLLEQKSDMCSV